MPRCDAHYFEKVWHVLGLSFLTNDVTSILNTQSICVAANVQHYAHIARRQFLYAGGLALSLTA
jgi:hypothetical protein